MSKKPLPPTGEIILYPTEDGRSRVECRFSGETVWLTQALLAELYQKDVRTINEHLQNLFEEGELDPEATIRKFRTVRADHAKPNMGLTTWRGPGVRKALFAADLRRVEDAKIQCGKAHFEALQVREAPAQYVVVRTFDDLMARVDS